MLVPGVEVPHLCAQCHDYPCVESCPVHALSVDAKTGAVLVNDETCTACGVCITACPGSVPHLHPDRSRVVICDLCGGEPACARICERSGYFALFKGQRSPSINYDLYAKNPEEITRNLAVNLYGEKGEEFV